MGLLVNGEWQDKWYDTQSTQGEFVRQDSQFRNWIGTSDFPAESGRYHLFVSYACPWAHRTLIFRKLKQLEEHINVTVVAPLMLEHGWELAGNQEESPLPNAQYLYQIYQAAQADYSGRVTVPVLWDKLNSTIVSNESAEIIRMFNSAFNTLTGNTEDYYPADLREEIDCINDLVYHTVNNGVYKCGFATTQQAYEKAFRTLFNTLDNLDAKLGKQRYLTGNRLTEADWRLFTTLIRFDAVYHGHFKTNLRQIENYPNLSNYLRELYQIPGIAGTVDMQQIKAHYYGSHTTINPTHIIPAGPELDFNRPHNRGQFS
ncbi:glutathione S-transferase family protein [Teredinibacter sp. KSP-S5-2]|uniref:glutathione S-transferase family protein n=1 Tax=Teredinibacter sp. KSP-S5-2 TaxID=3034506 RepID=UPI00293478CF|nr:glutathione S-transferase family protein [Teredinibacter sp. KSP-S5-2]WNO08796.1 glutathione S-transferase family protein [Teredinibacter sp. KSP-S5-2]